MQILKTARPRPEHRPVSLCLNGKGNGPEVPFRAALHTGTLTPYDLVAPFFTQHTVSPCERQSMDAAWRALEDFTGGENALVVMDGSGSMYGVCSRCSSCCSTPP